MKEENIGVLSAGERFGFKGFEWIVLDNNVDGGVLAIMASAWNNEEYRLLLNLNFTEYTTLRFWMEDTSTNPVLDMG